MRFILPCVLQRWWNRCSENTLPKDTKLECGQSRILNSRVAWRQIHRQHKNIGRGSPKVLRTAVWVLQSEGEWVGSQSLWGGAVLRGPQCWWSKRRGAGEKKRLGPGGTAVRFGAAPMQMAKRRQCCPQDFLKRLISATVVLSAYFFSLFFSLFSCQPTFSFYLALLNCEDHGGAEGNSDLSSSDW